MVANQPGTPAHAPVLSSGIVPPLADGYYPRAETGPDLARSLRPGQAAVLVHGEVTYVAPASQGGTGKTQLAVQFTRALRDSRAVQALAWVTAASRESVVAGFAQAADMLDVSHPGEDAEAAAARFVSWLAHTRRPWVLVIDDLREPTDLQDLWPAGASGRTLITTRLPAASFEGKDVRVIPAAGQPHNPPATARRGTSGTLPLTCLGVGGGACADCNASSSSPVHL